MDVHSLNPNVSRSGTVEMEVHSLNPNVRRSGTVEMDVHSFTLTYHAMELWRWSCTPQP